MANQWTKQQQQAISLRNRNLLVSAAAGSGKTAVLVERIIEMITDEESGVDIDHLLVVTFTRAAASEMKERIGLRLTQMLGEQPTNQHLQQQYTLLNHASIMTIDSFCSRVVKAYFNELDMDPDFRIAEEGELKLLQADTMADFLEAQYQKQDVDFLEFVNAYGDSKSDKPIEEAILQVFKFVESCPYPDEWIEQTKSALKIENQEDFTKSPWMQTFMEDIKVQLKECALLLQQAAEFCIQEDGPYYYEAMLQADSEHIRHLIDASDFLEWYTCLSTIKFVKKPSKKKDEQVDLKKQAWVSDVRDFVKEQIQTWQKTYCAMGLSETVEVCQQIQKPMIVLLNLVAEYREWFGQAKREKNLLDFADLEHLALQILVHRKEGEKYASVAAMELRKQYWQILIDEYQDSNYLQEEILTSISRCDEGHPNIFMVGDMKQSIYRFRQARPEIFQTKYKTYTEEESPYQKISLYQNFRSRKEVLDGINLIFEQIMSEALGNVVYDENAALHAGANFPTVSGTFDTECIVLDMDSKNLPANIEKLLAGISSKELEAKIIAQKIRKLTDAENGMQIFDKTTESYRTVQYKDIVILLRSFNSWVDEVLNTLLQEGIPAYAQSNTGYFSALEVQIVLNVLRIIDNPRQDIPLASVLLSPMVGFTSAQLAEIVACYKKVPEPKENNLYAMIEYYLHNAEDSDADLRKKLQYAEEQLIRYREMSVSHSVQELLHQILEETSYYDYVSAMPSGKVRRENLDMLIQKAIAYEKTSYHGVFHFVRYIENLQKYEVDYAEGSLVTENDDIVRITSIHKSKGLEYPVVIVAGIGKSFNNKDSTKSILFHPDMGIASDYIDYEHRYKIPTLVKKVIAGQLRTENLSEELRILYVAMTRAKEKLILIGSEKYLNARFQKWNFVHVCSEKELSSVITRKANSYLDWIAMAMQRQTGFSLEKLRQETCWTADGVFSVEIYPLLQVLSKDVTQEVQKNIEKEELLQMDTEQLYHEGVRKKLQQTELFTYPYLEDTVLHTKVSVSELKRMYDEVHLPEEEKGIFLIDEQKQEQMDEVEKEKAKNYEVDYEEEILPNFMKKETERSSAAMRGTSYHRIMELIDETKHCLYHTEAIKTYLEGQAKAGKIDSESLAQIDLWKIYHFYQTMLGKRMIQAACLQQLKKEQQFILSLPACEIYPEMHSEESVLIQGIIDAFFEEDGELVLVDYKTDHVKTKEELIQKYRAQFHYYQVALEQITGKRVKESFLYSFALGEALLISVEKED